MNQHFKARVWLVGTVLVHCLLPFHAWERRLNVNVQDFFHDVFDQPFRHRLNLFWRSKAHFSIDLCKFRLPVAPQVLITEAFSNLVVLVDPGRHQQLLKQLWRLRQSVEAARVDP